MSFFINTAGIYVKRANKNVEIKKINVRGYSKKKNKVKQTGTKKALEYFDDFYKGLFKYQWPSIRLALLSKGKHVALLNNFSDIEETEDFLKKEGAVNITKLFDNTECNVQSFSQESHLLGNTANEIIKDEIDNALNIIYPDGSNNDLLKNYLSKYKYAADSKEIDEDRKSNSFELNESRTSLTEDLSESQYDTTRLIDPAFGLSTNLLQEFVPATTLKGLEDYVPESDYYSFYTARSNISFNIEEETKLNFPEYLKVYSFPRGDVSAFPKPKRCINNVSNYYPLDGASILVVLALDLQPGDKVLDMCSAPGGKALAILQTMLPKILVCNDASNSRANRIENVFREYLYDYSSNWKKMLTVLRNKAEFMENYNEYNKILVDVPCTNDKHSVLVDDNNIFGPRRIKERLNLPQLQTSILTNALKLVKLGGTVVYSTCSLSPIQNEGVVNMALQKVWKDFRMEFTIRDLNPAVAQMSSFYKFAKKKIGLKYGILVLPFMPVNFGPMYFCKLVKTK